MSGREICCANLTMLLRPKRKSWKHLQKKGKKLYNNKINWSLTNFVKKHNQQIGCIYTIMLSYLIYMVRAYLTPKRGREG